MAKSKKLSTTKLVTAILYVVVGLLLAIMRGGALNILMTIVGVLFIALGVYDLVTKSVIRGVVEAVIGIAILICGWTITEWVLLIFGILLIIKGALDLIQNLKNGLLSWLAPLLTIVIGVLLVVSKFALIDVMCIIAGIVLIVNGVLVLLGKK